MSAWAVRFYDAEDRLLAETKVTAEGVTQAIDAARAVRRAVMGDVREREIQARTTKLIITRIASLG